MAKSEKKEKLYCSRVGKGRLKHSFQTAFYLFTLFQFRFEELLEFIKRNFIRAVVV